MSNKHRRLCAENRKVIVKMKQAGKTQDEIAQAIGFSQDTVSKKLSRNHGEAGSGLLLSVYERKSRIGRLHRLFDKCSAETLKAIVPVLHGLKVRSITCDNGLEFAMHELVNDLLECESYFCKPYRSWEKGGVENYNGLVRQYFPKGYDFATITPEHPLEVEDEINNRPRNLPLCFDDFPSFQPKPRDRRGPSRVPAAPQHLHRLLVDPSPIVGCTRFQPRHISPPSAPVPDEFQKAV